MRGVPFGVLAYGLQPVASPSTSGTNRADRQRANLGRPPSSVGRMTRETPQTPCGYGWGPVTPTSTHIGSRSGESDQCERLIRMPGLPQPALPLPRGTGTNSFSPRVRMSFPSQVMHSSTLRRVWPARSLSLVVIISPTKIISGDWTGGGCHLFPARDEGLNSDLGA
jgi:hypothetical protein